MKKLLLLTLAVSALGYVAWFWGSFRSDYGHNLAVREIQSKVFRGLPIGDLRPTVLSFLERRFGVPNCQNDDECYVDIERGDWPGSLYVGFHQGRLVEAMLLLSDEAFAGIPAQAVVDQLVAGSELLEREPDRHETFWLNRAQELAAGVVCGPATSAADCAIVLSTEDYARGR